MLFRFSHVRFSSRFFSAQAHNLPAFQRKLIDFTAHIPDYPFILNELQKKSFFVKKVPIPYTMDQFLLTRIPERCRSFLNKPLLKLLTMPLTQESIQPHIRLDARKIELPQALKELRSPLEHYVKFMIDLLNNRLAQRDYEVGVPTYENVSERSHALQAGTFALRFGLPTDKMLAMLLHDISRVTHPDFDFSNEHHHLESSDIVAPLGLSLDYTRHHGLAKYLLRKFCLPYSQLISPFSERSLSTQERTLPPLIEVLDTQLSSEELAKFIYEIMFLRVSIDDSSKIPDAKFVEELAGTPLASLYFDDVTIEKMLIKQLLEHLHQLVACNADIEQAAADYARKLDKALRLMVRAASYSAETEMQEYICPPVFRPGR